MEEDAPPLTNSVGSKGGGDADMPSPNLQQQQQQQQQATPAHAGNERQRQRQRGRVDFNCVSFGYPTRSGVLVLDGLSLTVRPGEKVAVVGSSGGGKSTILRLICRFYDPQGGSILLGGRDLSSYNPADISNVVSWVTQEPQLFPISVRENIAYGMGSYSMEDVYKAAKSANIHNFVSELPEGYDTLVGEGGASLSGGQKQRVAIARALIRDPEVLLLDEPTSALDVESERLVQDALDTAGKGRTVILIAHRLATIQRADRIVVMQNGRLVESGKHDELLSLGGVYAGLYKQGEQVATLQ
ncbi:ABC [Ectocarpus sp. CCAP 1310/34]|nr:ABC [Ectocarpus sp. CCAP 1310/34]